MGEVHDCDLGYVYITHPHADHFLGLPEILAAFPEARPVALAESIPAMEEQISPGYMQVWGRFFPGQLTARPVPPTPLAGLLHDEDDNGILSAGDPEQDPLYDEAVKIVTSERKPSISYVQRRLKIGYNRAARMLEAMEQAGIVGPLQSNGGREVLAPPPV